MSKKSDARTALIEARVVREREWMHARWMERMTFRQISAAAALPVEMGGLGVQISPAGCKAMVHAYREDRGDVTMGREERRERQSDEIDEMARAIRRDLARWAEEHDGAVNLKLVEALLALGKREADLHGLAAPTEIKAEIVTRDAVDAEIEAMLERLDA
jgi:hypothetical protein